MKAKIYLDFNSTHPPDVAALQVARQFYLENFANSSGLSERSQLVQKRIEEARATIASLLQISERQIVFTSCGTESNNLLIHELFRRAARRPFRVLSSPFEHPSVSECLKNLPDTEITYLTTDKAGLVAPDLSAYNLAEFDLVTIMAVQNESGVILPLLEIAASLPAEHPPILADFAQALPKITTDGVGILSPNAIKRLTQQNIFITATGHKVGAGFGAGLIVLPAQERLRSSVQLLSGGNQEHGLRAGSHNIEAIVAVATALDARRSSLSYAKWQSVTQDFEVILHSALAQVAGNKIIAEQTPRAPGTTLLLLPNIPIDFLIMGLDNAGITVSTGTSCKSRSRTASAALLAMGYSEAEALGVIRLSYGSELSHEHMHTTAEALKAIAGQLGD